VLSQDDVLDAADIVLGTVGHSGPLAAGDAYTVRSTFTVPVDVSGAWRVLVRSDLDGSVFEGGRTANNTATAPGALIVTPAPAANLVASAVAAAPATALAGSAVTVSWTVRNDGEASAAGPWVDQVLFSRDGQLATATLVGSLARSSPLAPGESYDATLNVTLPQVADSDAARLFVVLDALNQVWEQQRESDNTASAPVALRHVDLRADTVSAPASAQSGDIIHVSFDVTQAGTAALTGRWTDRVVLSHDTVADAGDRVLGERTIDTTLAAGATYRSDFDVALPIDSVGPWFLIGVTDAAGAVLEVGAESNNTAAAPLSIALAPYADLQVGNVTAPTQLVADPARVTVGWTVTNTGTGAGQTLSWTDTVIASRDAIAGNFDDIVLGKFDHTGGLNVGDSYSRSETMFAPPALTGRFTVFVRTDSQDVVFENGSEANNVAAAPDPLDVMPIPYADLSVVSVDQRAGADRAGAVARPRGDGRHRAGGRRRRHHDRSHVDGGERR
jgi:hypothetical protein